MITVYEDVFCPVCGAEADLVETDTPGIWVFCQICNTTFDIQIWENAQ